MQELEGNLSEVLEQEGKIALDFYGTWCGPCNQMLPIYTKLDQTMSDITFYKVDVDKNRDVVEKYGIRSIPTVVVLNNGEEVGRFSGSMSEDAVIEKLNEF